MEKIEYLKKYNSTIEILDLRSLNEEQVATLPKFWSEALSENLISDKVKIILDQWKKFPYQFQSTTYFLNINLLDVDLVAINEQFALLYTVRNLKGDNAYYIGYNPIEKKVPKYFEILPDSFKDVYNDLHNGWLYYASQSNGLLPIEDTVILGDEDWGILEEISVETLPFELSNCVGLFDNGKGDYASIDLKANDKKKGFIWWHTKAPKLDVEIWPIIDEWTKIGIER
ncbi:hypothetical protein [Sphingobacterium sp. BIGb0165]|uniref:hypothetical protein n=1 Tax=Sphingobacterium sp. BIGb0165 TaxID=2940615 RepID=UPI0021691571|nr:hypothetical protein [Sphingobacterium sp. BIGb0165]MCS4225900.1 hypothetical protein [Sphingobacterium sp. BIGb0165]